MKNYIPYILALGFFLMILQRNFAQPFDLVSPAAHRYQLDNPAAAGLDNAHHIFAGIYKKWYQIQNAPSTVYVSSAHPFFNRALGIGGTIIQDKTGLLTSTILGLNAAIHLNPESQNKFSIGATARYRAMRVDEPNVPDLIQSDGLQGTNINIGLGINYQAEFANNDGFFNLYAFFPQMPWSVTLDESQSETPLEYKLSSHMVIQGNLRLPLSEGVYFTPSLRYQAQPLNGYLDKTQVVDLALGLSLMDDALRLRVGGRSGAAGMIYGGVGFAFGSGFNVQVAFEPGGRLGSSAAADAELIIQGKDPIIACWEKPGCIEEGLKKRDIDYAIDATVSKDPLLNQTYIRYSFSDKFDTFLDFFEHDIFLSQVPLDELIDEIQAQITAISESKQKLIGIRYLAEINHPLSTTSDIPYEDSMMSFDYLENGIAQRAKSFVPNEILTNSKLGAIKLYNLRSALARRLGENATDGSELDVRPGNNSGRRISIILTVK